MTLVNNLLKISQFIQDGKRGEEQAENKTVITVRLYAIKHLCFIEIIPVFQN
jgi:hypothetical protein